MRFTNFATRTALPLLLCMVCSAPLCMKAQDDGSNGPPKVLVIQREYTKPGKGGALHEKTEGAFIQAVKAGKGDLHYLAMTSMSGPDRALFFSAYPSFAAWEEENKAVAKKAGLGAALDHANVADGDLLASADASVWMRSDEMSNQPGNLVGARYMEITLYQLKPGHGREWEEAVKLVKEAYIKGVPDIKWAMFSHVYGTMGDAYIVLQPLKSLGEVDHHFAEGKMFMDALGKDGLKKLDELVAASVEMTQTNLFHFNPRMSLPPDGWVQAEPDYWKPKVMAPKPAVPPAQ
jgi:hypothetical protein